MKKNLLYLIVNCNKCTSMVIFGEVM